MPELLTDVPAQVLHVRREYLFDLQEAPAEPFEEAVWFAVASRPGRAVDCWCHFTSGAVRDGLPLSALCTRPHAEHIPLEALQLWNCFSARVVAVELDWLAGLRVETILKDRSVHEGTYLFTLDWHGSPIADAAGEAGHKCGHVVACDCGCIVVQPNNRLMFREGSFATRPVPIAEARRMGWRVNTRDWRVERTGKWHSEDAPQFFYDGSEVESR